MSGICSACAPFSQGHVWLKVNADIIANPQMHTTHYSYEQSTPPAHPCCVLHSPRREQLRELTCLSVTFSSLICGVIASLTQQDSQCRLSKLKVIAA